MTKNYDNFSKLSIDKMAQAITDMTYLYKSTVVPKSHYKKQLDEVVELHVDQMVSTAMLDVYVKTIKSIIDDSPKLFLKAMLCIENKINPSNMRPHEAIALDEVANYFTENKLKSMLIENITSLFDEHINNDDDEYELFGTITIF